MASCFTLLVLTPEKRLWDGSAQQVIFSKPDGRIGIMAGHMPIVAVVAEGTLEIQYEDGTWRVAAISQGFVEVTGTRVEFFVDSAEWAEDIDMARAQEALRRAEERLTQQLDRLEYARTCTAIARATARLKAAKTTPTAR